MSESRVEKFGFAVLVVVGGDLVVGHRLDIVIGQGVVGFDEFLKPVKIGDKNAEFDTARLKESGHPFSSLVGRDILETVEQVAQHPRIRFAFLVDERCDGQHRHVE